MGMRNINYTVFFSYEIPLSLFLPVLYCSQINNGVYRAGFARAQAAYDTAVREVFDGLDKV